MYDGPWILSIVRLRNDCTANNTHRVDTSVPGYTGIAGEVKQILGKTPITFVTFIAGIVAKQSRFLVIRYLFVGFTRAIVLLEKELQNLIT
jgi:hypothetical protein